MNVGAIWWEQIGTSRRFLNEIEKNMEAANSAVLHIPEKMPWENHFYALVDHQNIRFSDERQMKRVEWRPGNDPGAFVLDHLCSGAVKTDYYPGQTYAAYLGSRGDILLCDYYVWVTGVETTEDINQWVDFVTQYNEQARTLDKRAIFIIEYAGSFCSTKQVTCLTYRPERIDYQVFCLELASAFRSSSLRDFQAELALRIGGEDPELSALLIGCGESFVSNPIGTTQAMLQGKLRSDRSPFKRQTKEQLESAVWNADIVTLFPVLEQWRLTFISKHTNVLRAYLPVTNSNGEKVEEPFDLELGSLLYIAAQNQPFTKDEYEQLKLCRSVRNKLAHNQTVSFSEVCAVLRL